MFLGCLPCCDGGEAQPCGCGPQDEVRPVSLTVEFEGFVFEPDPSISNTPGEAEDAEDGMTAFVAGLGPVVLPLLGAAGALGYQYGTLGCSTSEISQGTAVQFRDVGCQACPPDFYSMVPIAIDPFSGAGFPAPSIRVSIACNGVMDRRRADEGSVGGTPEKWTFWRPLIATGNVASPTWQPSACGNQLWEFNVFFGVATIGTTLPQHFVTPICEGQFDPQEFTSARILSSAHALAGDNSFQRYIAPVGTVRITPNYANPLP
jgi:hypothetical protein